ERILATARAVLAVGSLASLSYVAPGRFVAGEWLQALLLLYTAHSITLLILSRFQREVTRKFRYWVQVTDVAAPAAICLLTNGPNSPFFLLFVFALLAAAFRWGMRQALVTMVASVAAVAGETILSAHGRFRSLASAPPDVDRFVLRTLYLVIFAFLIGYLAESEKRRRAEALSISQVSSKVRVDAGLKGSLQAAFQETLRLFGGSEMLLVARETGTQLASLWRGEQLEDDGELVFSWSHLSDQESEDYLFALPDPGAGAAWRKGNWMSRALVDKEGSPVRRLKCPLSAGFAARHTFDRVLSSDISFSPDIQCRIFLFEPRLGGNIQAQMQLLQQLTSRVAPAIYNVYLIRRLRSRAAAVERARVARELHDGVVQSLHAIAFRLYALRTGTGIDGQEREHEMLEIQELVQHEATNIRTLIQQLKPLNFDHRRLVDFLSGMIERFRYDTGIAAKFVCDVGEVRLPPQACREVAGIVQEGLANTLKHSGAEKVLVRLGSGAGRWILTIEDDGRGFEFSGRLSQTELEKSRRGPSVIKERVRTLGGDLTIESKPGQGSRLEITFPQIASSNIL
ncbi:MAG TPA: histidine kinase, partial [Terriglobales bacterium]|nr:histidine kinase [Terriglobales bacterium]